MGGIPSKSGSSNNGFGSGLATHLQCIAALKKEETEIVKLMMPVWYTEIPPSNEDVAAARSSWDLVLQDKALSLTRRPLLTFIICFYGRLFDMHPIAKDVFQDPSGGKFLTRFMEVMLKERDDPIKFRIALARLAEIHHSRGVKAVEYGVLVVALLWTLETILDSTFTIQVQAAWIKVLSGVLQVLVPIAVSYELKDSSPQDRRLTVETNPFLLGIYEQKQVYINVFSSTSIIRVDYHLFSQ